MVGQNSSGQYALYFIEIGYYRQNNTKLRKCYLKTSPDIQQDKGIAMNIT